MKSWLLIVCFAGLIGTVMAQPGERRRAMARERVEERMKQQDPHQMMVEKLNLNESQKKQMEELHVAHHSEMQKIKVALDIKEAELFAATTENDEKKALKLVDEVADLRQQKLKAQTLHQMKVRNLLDEKQQLLFDEFRYEKKERKKRQHRGS